MLHDVLIAIDGLTFVYFVVLDAVALAMVVIGWRAVSDYVRRRPMRDYDFVAHSPLSPPLTILVPAHDEEATIVGSVRALLATHYPRVEVMVINDGSTDATVERLRDAFDLVPTPVIPRAWLPCQPVRSLLRSRTEPRLSVVDKENGGKADALNAGLRHVWTPLFCSIDADTLLDPDALNRLVWEFETSPDTVAAGGIVRVVNGSKVSQGLVSEVKTPRDLLANLQILEYLRAFLGGRIAWSRLGMLLIISGAFGLFRRDAVIEAGGYDADTVGEDAELILRLHRHRSERRQPCRVVFFPDPICWTEAPTSLGVLIRQRDRWQRGLLEMLFKHRRMLGNPRYGRVGTLAMPYFLIFEALGPLVEVGGYLAFGTSVAIGAVSWEIASIFLVVAIAFGLGLSSLTLMIEGRAFRRYPGWSCLWRLLMVSVLENAGYRQLMSFVRARAWWRVRGSRSAWGAIPRQGFGDTAGTPVERLAAG